MPLSPGVRELPLFTVAGDLSPFTGPGTCRPLPASSPLLDRGRVRSTSHLSRLRRVFTFLDAPVGSRNCPLASFPRTCCPCQGPAGVPWASPLAQVAAAPPRGACRRRAGWGLPSWSRCIRYCRFRSQCIRRCFQNQNIRCPLHSRRIHRRRAGRRRLRRPSPSNRRHRHCRLELTAAAAFALPAMLAAVPSAAVFAAAMFATVFAALRCPSAKAGEMGAASQA